MKFPTIKNPTTGKPDIILTLSALACSAAIVKFLLEGVTLQVSGHVVDFGHVDSLTYGTLLAPILGAHSWTTTKTNNRTSLKERKTDNPDDN